MDHALKYFKKNDKILYNTALEISLNPLSKPDDYFVDLVESIISQQLSGKAAATIFARFKKLFPGEKITEKRLLKIPDEKIRNAGISYSKIKYIKGIAKETLDGNLDLNKMDDLNDREVIIKMTKLYGVGAWTAEMFLMFTLLRPDVFSAGDLGLQNAIIKLYKLEQKPDRDKLLEISAKWSPYRSTASRILWNVLDSK